MPLTILIVDDDPGIRLSVGDYLDLCGYTTIAAENGKQALELVGKHRPHLMITDALMPEMDGYELIRQVRSRPELRLLPVIFLTEKTDTSDRVRGYKLGCDLYMPKPFELEELEAVVRNFLERSHTIQTEWQFRARSSAPDEPEPADITIDFAPREREVLEHLVKGLSNAEIGDRIHLSPRTVEKYVSKLFRKTDTNNRAELVRFAIEHHLM